MPHTSRKKQQGPKKRLQITDDAGWTHITKTTNKQKYTLQSASWSKQLSPTQIPRGITTQDVLVSLNKYMAIWKDSSCFSKLKILLRDIVLSSNTEITSCVCLGLGSFSGGKFPETSFFELAALVSLLEILSQKHEIKETYMQDPILNALDSELLQQLGYTVIPSPSGFSKIDSCTFLFAPHLEWSIYAAALQNTFPALCVGNDVMEYLDAPVTATSEEARSCFRSFMENCHSVPMPSFDRSSWCESTRIYWQKAVEVDDLPVG